MQRETLVSRRTGRPCSRPSPSSTHPSSHVCDGAHACKQSHPRGKLVLMREEEEEWAEESIANPIQS